MLSVGFVGVGGMGAPMVERLVGAGVDVTAFARRDEVRERIRSLGAKVANDLAEVASADVVIVCVFSDAQLDEVVLGDDGLLALMKPDSILAVHTTGSPNTSVAIAAAASERGVHALDAPVSGGPDDIRRGKLALLVGGDPAALERARPAFASYCDPIMHLGPTGAGQRMKLVNNILFAAHAKLAIEAVRLAQALGIQPADLATTLRSCSGTSYALELLAAMDPEQLDLLAAPYMRKDVAVVEQTAAELGIDLGVLGDIAQF